MNSANVLIFCLLFIVGLSVFFFLSWYVPFLYTRAVTLNENKNECIDGWWEDCTTEFGMEWNGELPYDFDNNPYAYYYDMAKELDFKIKDCGYQIVEGERCYGCSICYEWG